MSLVNPEEVENRLPARPSLSSRHIGWSGLRVSIFPKHPPAEVEIPACDHHVIYVNLRRLDRLIQMREGQVHDGAIPKGGMILVPAGIPSKWRWDQMSAVAVLFISPTIIARSLLDATAYPEQFEITSRFCFHDPLIEQIAMALKSELEAEGLSLGGRLYGECVGSALGAHLLRHYGGAAPRMAQHRGGLSGCQLRRVIDYIDQNLGSDLSLAELAEIAGVSPCHFVRAFRQSTGITPHRYILHKCVERAKQMLAKGGTRIADIGQQLRFSDQSQFTKVFHRFTGTTPGVYQGRQRN